MSHYNFVINCIKQDSETQEYIQRSYTCRSFDAYESGKFVFRGFNGVDENEVVIYCGPDAAYERIYVMNMNGTNVASHDSRSYHEMKD